MKFIETSRDRWHTIVGDDGPMVTLTPAPHSLLNLHQWVGGKAQWPVDVPVGVLFPNDADIEQLANDLPRLSLVVLQFPKWTDGRAYTQARLLRSRFGYTSEIRAIGEVLVDMMQLLHRTGFDSVVLRGDQSIQAAEHALALFSGFYQGDVHERRPLFQRPAGEEYSPQEFNQAGSAI